MSIITFHELIFNQRPPMRATKNAGGHLPDRHHRCEPVRAASGLGWYVFLPIDFFIKFDGVESLISLDDGETWFPLTYMQYPDFAVRFDESAPPEAQGYSPPFVSMTEDHAIVQVWTGYVARTAPDYSLLVRGPANFIAGLGYQHFEGIIETDRWFGPLFTNVKLLKTDVPIHFRSDRPFIQVSPINRAHYADSFLNDFEIIDEFTGFDWTAYGKTVVAPNSDHVNRRVGAYAAEARQRRAKEG